MQARSGHVEPFYAVLCDMRPLLVGERSEIRAFLADVAWLEAPRVGPGWSARAER
jgi:hypothetical protein